jgi:hypothetical protein
VVIGDGENVAPLWLTGAVTVKFYHRWDGDADVTPEGEFSVAISNLGAGSNGWKFECEDKKKFSA